MRSLLALIGSSIGGWIGWWIGAMVGLTTGVVLSILGMAAGLYLARRFTYEYLD